MNRTKALILAAIGLMQSLALFGADADKSVVIGKHWSDRTSPPSDVVYVISAADIDKQPLYDPCSAEGPPLAIADALKLAYREYFNQYFDDLDSFCSSVQIAIKSNRSVPRFEGAEFFGERSVWWYELHVLDYTLEDWPDKIIVLFEGKVVLPTVQ